MDAFLFTIALFGFFGVVGCGVLTLFTPRLAALQTSLIAPSIGIATTIGLVFALSRLGLAVQDFGAIAFAGLAVASVAVIALRRPSVPSDLRYAFPILLVALLLAAWPMLLYGFDWVSFANDDMANYALGAQRFLTGGFFAAPDFDTMFEGKDYSVVYWMMHVAGGVRPGSELMLSAVWAASGLNAHFIFMPVIFALHLSLISATGALVASAASSRIAPFIAMGLMALSPMSTLGALYQLIGQVGGLALLCSAIVLTYRPVVATRPLSFIVANIPAAIIFGALVIWYPELLPFFGLGWLIYVGALLLKDRANAGKTVLAAAVVGFIVVVVMNSYVVEAVSFMLNQTVGGMKASSPSDALFPYFLVPSGIAALFGILPIGNQIGEPWLSLAILLGSAFLIWLFVWVLPRQIRTMEPALAVFLAMAAVGFVLFFRNNDFGLFKLVMFIQPVLLCIVARVIEQWKLRLGRQTFRSISAALLIIVVAIPVIATQSGYVGKSTGEFYGGFNEVPHASSARISRQFGEFVGTLPKGDGVSYFADTTNIVLAKFQALYSRGIPLLFPSRNFFANILDLTLLDPGHTVLKRYEATMTAYADAKEKYLSEEQITTGAVTNTFSVPIDLSTVLHQGSMITTTENQTIFNGVSASSADGYFALVPNPANKLIFVNSDLGNHYYLGNRDRISFYALENDPMFPGEVFSALGQHLLFLAVNPSETARIRMELSDTVLRQYGSTLPDVLVQGEAVGFVGRGSGRVYSSPVSPTNIDGVPYIAIDMNRIPTPIAVPLSGLMSLYGREIPQDTRRIAAFGRDISLVSDANYLALTPSVSISTFPADLQDINLEYSGIYEDGWISERAFFTLAPTPQSKFLIVRGMIPMIGDENHASAVTVSINGAVVAKQPLALGAYEVKVPITDVSAKIRIDLAFDNPQTLPNGDGRISAGRLDFLGFVEE